MELFQGMFDQGFSGIINGSSRKTMPDYIEKLAESEINYEPPVLDVPDITYDKDSSLLRANELTSDNSRDASKDNRFTIEKIEQSTQDYLFSNIDKTVIKSIEAGKSFDKIQACLLQKNSKDVVNKFLESKISLILNRYAFLGFDSIREKLANIVDQAKKDIKIKRSTVHDILDKFSKLEFVTNSVVKEYKNLLSHKRPLYVAANFLFSLDTIKRSYYETKEARVTFQRDIDEKESSVRNVQNNEKRSSVEKKQLLSASMLSDYKEGLNLNLAKSEIIKKLAKKYGYSTLKQFIEKNKDCLKNIDYFGKRQTFSTNFASVDVQEFEVEPKAKPISIDVKSMFNYALRLMTSGQNIETVKTSLKKNFGFEAATQFLSENETKLRKFYGQIGFIFVDSNIYSNCDELSECFSKLQHTGSKLIYSVKANSKCPGCSFNKEGSCSKFDLLISNNPLVRSPRASKRVFERASSFVPKAYIETFSSKLSNSNIDLISTFCLGIDNALSVEKQNIGKQASKDRSNSIISQESFITPESYDIEIFNNKVESSIINKILGE